MQQEKDGRSYEVFGVEIRGRIAAPGDTGFAKVQICVADITDGIEQAKCVRAKVKQWQIRDSSEFCYEAELGKLPDAGTIVSEWMSVGQIPCEWLNLPRKGQRVLQFTTSVLLGGSGQELACGVCNAAYENPVFGYIDSEENVRRAKSLAVALSFSVSAADGKMYDCEIEVVKNWARNNIDFAEVSNKARRRLERALKKTAAFFREGSRLDVRRVCRELVEIAPVGERYDILELCLCVVHANGVVAAEELAILKELADWLEVDKDRFRMMMEKILPAEMYEVADVETVLGVTADMSGESAREHLKREYRKWNCRVTSQDPDVQSQADYMLSFIAEARSQIS